MSMRRGAEFWRKHLDGWKQSGLTQVVYCARHGISIKTFTRWRSKEIKDGETVPAPMTLVPARLDRASPEGAVRLYSPGGWRIELAGSNLAQLTGLLRSLP